METTNLQSVGWHMIGQVLKQMLFPPSRKRWRLTWQVSRILFKYLLDLARNPALFWDTMEEAANVRLTDLEEELNVPEELASLWETVSNFMTHVPSLMQSELIPRYYEWETREWIQAAISSDDPRQVYVNVLKRITRVLEGHNKPLFVPFKISTPNPEWIECLQAGNVVEALEKIEGVSFERILSRLNADTALVYLITSGVGTYAIITRQDVLPEILLCKTFTHTRVENLLRGWMWLYYWHREHHYHKTIERTIQRQNIPADKSIAFREAAIEIPYRRIFYNQPLFEHLQPTEVPSAEGMPIIPFPSWLLMEAILRELGTGDLVSGEGLWQQIDERLYSYGIKRIVLCPDKALALFPHHGAILNIESDGQKEFLLDKYEVIYLPQGTFSQSASAKQQSPHLLAFGTDGDALSELGIASLRALLSDHIVEWHASRGDGMPRKQFATDLSRLNVNALTFLGHGGYDWENPSQSYLGILGDGRHGLNALITLGFLRTNMPSQLSTIVLAGCETGLPKVTAQISDYKGFAEDLISMPSVSTVISTLWPVHQISSVLLMRQFHQYWLLGDSKTSEKLLSLAEALHRAQLWLRMLTREQAIAMLEMLASVCPAEEIEREIQTLRESFVERPYAHPYFWSSFYVTGGIQ